MVNTKKRYKAGTLVFHKKRQQFGKMVTGYPMKARAAGNENEIVYKCTVEIMANARTCWYLSNLIIVDDDKTKLAIQLKYSQ